MGHQGFRPWAACVVHLAVTDRPSTVGRLRGVLIRENFREYLDHLLHDGYTVRHDEHGSDPDLIDPGGNPIETWREDYPYQARLDREIYEARSTSCRSSC